MPISLQRSYGTNGAGLIIQDQDYAVWYDRRAFAFPLGTLSGICIPPLSLGEQAAKRIRELLDMGRYIPKDELEQVPAFERRRIAQSLCLCRAGMLCPGERGRVSSAYSENLFLQPRLS